MALTRADILPACTARVAQVFTRLGAYAPRARYLGRSINITASGHIDSGIVKVACSFLTASGFERELEVPVVIYNGEIVDPAFAMIHGNPVILDEGLFQSISDKGTISEMPHLGAMYSTAFVEDLEGYKALKASLAEVPILYRPLF